MYMYPSCTPLPYRVWASHTDQPLCFRHPISPQLTCACSIKAAAEGSDENINNKDDPEVRRLYDRNSSQYPYRSHGQHLRAWYALTCCVLFILFNGWRAFVEPVDGGDFVACYVCVRLSLFLLAASRFAVADLLTLGRSPPSCSSSSATRSSSGAGTRSAGSAKQPRSCRNLARRSPRRTLAGACRRSTPRTYSP